MKPSTPPKPLYYYVITLWKTVPASTCNGSGWEKKEDYRVLVNDPWRMWRTFEHNSRFGSILKRTEDYYVVLDAPLATGGRKNYYKYSIEKL